ncbi:2-succinyl-5-enolpyruvyl-6-hydroxy-3-cyclohexene-1-carboxylic-acid synthase [Aureivirga sp. CE67]|uniref:2-succinyl-5-enolpyruvyl-6-hydroxy-3- cyclohexene-1-carboxylic-acid synthase n=1 Tax=Aureivirga sp. CE67 TaxID=1788983 RepID=UPI0018CA28CC|nr:2-succinyl-5-enolpyruvyl-6-hydroxy-3-cyclohexene-1-carboxylic-acid synthase [Aureivirga sp. CE67]
MQEFPKKKIAQDVVLTCEKYGIRTAVISPGSRNAALTIGFSNYPNIKALSVVDERCASFFALGIAQQTKRPVAIVCTSGSALLNYYPAVAEAFYNNIPLVVISADRPKHLIDIADGQTIRQENVLEKHILYSANLIEHDSESNQVLLQKALETALDQNGPVHINVPMDEPLYEIISDFQIEESSDEIYQESQMDAKFLEVSYLDIYAEKWNKAKKKIVLIGQNYPSELLSIQMEKMIKDPSVLIFTETTSNIPNDKFINSIDKLITPLNEEELEDLAPEILLSFGGMVVSKRIKQFLRKYKPAEHWHISKKNAPNTFHCLTNHFQISPENFFSQFFFLTEEVESDYQQKWLSVKENRKEKHISYMDSIPFSDMKAFESILNKIPDNSNVQLSNSSVIRYTQLFDVNKSLNFFCNRGTSGIEGSTSTAVGAAYASEKQTTFITGDVSFFYDSNGLWNANIPKDFRIILINNSGGGIFKFIPGPSQTNAEDYFVTPHNLTAKQLAEMFHFEYKTAVNLEELDSELTEFYKESEQPKILELFTPSEENDKILKAYFKSL